MRAKFDPIAHAEEAWRMLAFPVNVTAAAKTFKRAATGTGSSTRYIRAIEYEENGMKHRGAFVVRIIHGSGITPPYWIDSSRSIRGGIERGSSDAAVGLAHGWEPYDAEESVERIAICLWKAMRPINEVDMRSDESYRVRVVDGVTVAKCRIRYWSHRIDVGGGRCDVLPEFGNFEIQMETETNQLLSGKCRSSDLTTDLATISGVNLKTVYEKAGVRLCHATTSRAPRAFVI